MEKIRKTVYIILSVIAVLVAIGSLLSIFRNTESRFLKMLDFPRIQFFITSVLSLILFVILTKRWQWYDYLLMVGLTGGMIVQGNYLIHYTPLVAEAVPMASKAASSDDQLSLLLVNVKMSNRTSQPILDLIQDKRPDLVLAMEVNTWWDEQLKAIEKDYPHTKESVNDEAYGMTLYSKYPFKEITVNYLNNENVPSFESTITLPNGKDIGLHTIHPVPPTHYKDLPDNAGQEEMAMLKLGKKIENAKLPTIVAGDFNDVVWSYTDELTGTKDMLHDVRVGRGFYNSYNAENIFMRWPLDHIFVTKEFQLRTLERLPDVGSDHFPIYVELVL